MDSSLNRSQSVSTSREATKIRCSRNPISAAFIAMLTTRSEMRNATRDRTTGPLLINGDLSGRNRVSAPEEQDLREPEVPQKTPLEGLGPNVLSEFLTSQLERWARLQDALTSSWVVSEGSVHSENRVATLLYARIMEQPRRPDSMLRVVAGQIESLSLI